MKSKRYLFYSVIVLLCFLTALSCSIIPTTVDSSVDSEISTAVESETATDETTIVPQANPQGIIAALSYLDFNGNDAFEIVNDNVPFFTKEEITDKSYEFYSELDSLGRCGVCVASVGQDLMPSDERESISSVYPTGWKYNGKSNNKKYSIVEAGWIYNRCHLIGFQLTGENANKLNLVTGTRYLNIDGMISFENMIADFVKETGMHVMYRVTPIFKDDNMLCDGLLLEGYSVEDNGEAIQFCVFSFNVQPGIFINYLTGENELIEEK